jgi:glutamine cyclotransferase
MAWLGGLLVLAMAAPVAAEVPVQTYEVVAAYPHDREAFTQGLFILDGALFETTGLYPSTLRQVRL